MLLTLGNQGVYHANFRFGKGFNGESAMWIGTIQGYKDGLDNAKIVTKRCLAIVQKLYHVPITSYCSHL